MVKKKKKSQGDSGVFILVGWPDFSFFFFFLEEATLTPTLS